MKALKQWGISIVVIAIIVAPAIMVGLWGGAVWGVATQVVVLFGIRKALRMLRDLQEKGDDGHVTITFIERLDKFIIRRKSILPKGLRFFEDICSIVAMGMSWGLLIYLGASGKALPIVSKLIGQ